MLATLALVSSPAPPCRAPTLQSSLSDLQVGRKALSSLEPLDYPSQRNISAKNTPVQGNVLAYSSGSSSVTLLVSHTNRTFPKNVFRVLMTSPFQSDHKTSLITKEKPSAKRGGLQAHPSRQCSEFRKMSDVFPLGVTRFLLSDENSSQEIRG